MSRTYCFLFAVLLAVAFTASVPAQDITTFSVRHNHGSLDINLEVHEDNGMFSGKLFLHQDTPQLNPKIFQIMATGPTAPSLKAALLLAPVLNQSQLNTLSGQTGVIFSIRTDGAATPFFDPGAGDFYIYDIANPAISAGSPIDVATDNTVTLFNQYANLLVPAVAVCFVGPTIFTSSCNGPGTALDFKVRDPNTGNPVVGAELIFNPGNSSCPVLSSQPTDSSGGARVFVPEGDADCAYMICVVVPGDPNTGKPPQQVSLGTYSTTDLVNNFPRCSITPTGGN